MQRIRVADCVRNVLNRELGQFQKLCSLDHAVLNKEFLWSLTECLPEDCPEVAAVQAALGSDIFYRDIVLEILLDKGKRLSDIKILDFAAFSYLKWCHGPGQIVQKEKTVAEKMQGRFF